MSFRFFGFWVKKCSDFGEQCLSLNETRPITFREEGLRTRSSRRVSDRVFDFLDFGSKNCGFRGTRLITDT
ncbi:unnamed protein product [Meloidogyne enterolobii]|uniref:Uncharacterized protein n=1 Tax=Meloidogyne enterolobii TaxID=390850 RepID=A0ACB1AR90_MELEN